MTQLMTILKEDIEDIWKWEEILDKCVRLQWMHFEAGIVLREEGGGSFLGFFFFNIKWLDIFWTDFVFYSLNWIDLYAFKIISFFLLFPPTKPWPTQKWKINFIF